MSVCSLCGTPIADTPSEYRIVLEIEDMTRSTKQFMGDETRVKRVCADQRLCVDCWDGLTETVSPPDDD